MRLSIAVACCLPSALPAASMMVSLPGGLLTRPIQHPGCPSFFPASVAAYNVALAVFCDFRDNFRKFEAWHIHKRQRLRILKEKHDATCKQLFTELREAPSSHVDLLISSRSYGVLACEPADRLLHVDPQLDTSGHSECRLDGLPVSITPISADTCRVDGAAPLSADSELSNYITFLGHPSRICTRLVKALE